MTTVHVIMGSTGEYSDHREWLVAAHSTEAAAQAHVAALDALLLQHGFQPGGAYYQHDYESRDRAKEIIRAIDPGFDIDYTGTRYSIEAVALDPSVPA